jgi:hypothetical protein
MSSAQLTACLRGMARHFKTDPTEMMGHVTYTSKQRRLTTKNVLSADIWSHLHSAMFVFNRQFVGH